MPFPECPDFSEFPAKIAHIKSDLFALLLCDYSLVESVVGFMGNEPDKPLSFSFLLVYFSV